MSQASASFSSMGLKAEIVQGLATQGFNQPSALQQRAIPTILRRSDTFVHGPSGTDRSAIFAATVLQTIDPSLKSCQALILTSTRESAMQAVDFVTGVCGSLKIKIRGCYGGTKIDDDIQALRDGVHVVIGTSGRIFDMVSRAVLKVDQVKMVALDDLDSGSASGSIDTVSSIASNVPSSAQYLVLAATASQNVLTVADKHMQHPVKISAVQDASTLQGSRNFKLTVGSDEEKGELLSDLLQLDSNPTVFCNTKAKADSVTSKLKDLGYDSVVATSDPLASNVQLSGKAVSILFELPSDPKNYADRVAWLGTAVTLVTAADAAKLKETEKLYNIEIKEMPESGFV